MDLARLARTVQMVSFVGPDAPAWLLGEIAAGTGAVCLFAGNIRGDGPVATLVAALRAARPDVLVALDEEGGDVTRLDQRRGSDLPGAAALGVVDDVAVTAAVHRVIGRRLAALGIDLDLAPCADVNIAAANPVIGVRSFGADARRVARHVAAAVDGLQAVGVAACVKHFPGHGATVADSHQALPVLDVDAATLRRRELVPFRTRAAAVMTAHIVVPALDAVPATRSRALLGLLREELGFTGAVVSDALDMAGVHGPGVGFGDVTPAMIGDAAVRSLAAGCDLLCLGAGQGPEVPAAVTAAITAAVAEGRLSGERLADAARRVAAISRRGEPRAAGVPDAGPDEEVAAGAAAAALRVTGAPLERGRRPLVVDCRPTVSMANHDVVWGLGAAVAALDPTAACREADAGTDPARLVAAAAGRPLVVAVRAAPAHPWQLDLLGTLAAARPDLVAVELGWPSDPVRGASYPGATTITTFGASRASTRAAAGLLTGGPSGR